MTTSNQYVNRTLVSFRGRCPMHCKHCYTYDLEEREEKSLSEIVKETGHESFDIIYLSQKYENFYDEDQGFALCQQLYDKYQKDILIITRSYLSDSAIERLGHLNQKMRKQNNQLYIAVSLCADNSYTITEDQMVCPAPHQRLENLRRGQAHGIKTLLLLRPVFPNAIIPIEECIGILDQAKDYVNAVISSGLIVTNSILERLDLEEESLNYLENGDSEYLSDLKNARYLDVEHEISQICDKCKEKGIPFFRHSMPALNYLATMS